MLTPAGSSLHSGLVSTPAMDAVFSDAAQIQAMVQFEAALAAALEDNGLAPSNSAAFVHALLEKPFLTPERARAIQRDARAAGNVAIPFLKLLTSVVEQTSPAAAATLHTGATSQDVLDTALVLCMREAFPLLLEELDAVHNHCADLAMRYAATPMAGRTWLQQGPPVTLGLKFAGAAAALARQQQRMGHARDQALCLQFGGAVGTLASLGDHGLSVSASLARHLDLREAPLPWHTYRDSLAEVASVLGNLLGTLGKMARDFSLMMQTEVGELSEPSAPGRGGSSTMPQKRNPVGCAAILAAAVRAPGLVASMLTSMVQEHERGLGGWQAEWPLLPELFCLTAAALAQMREIVAGLEVHPEALAANLTVHAGLAQAEAIVAALTPHLGRPRAHRLLEEASQTAHSAGCSLESVLGACTEITAHLPPERIAELLAPANYLGSTAAFIRRGLGSKPKRS